MLNQLQFVGPDGPYSLSVDLADQDLEDAPIEVDANGAISTWHIEVDQMRGDVRELSGLTARPNVYWFVLKIEDPCQIEYYGDRVLLRVDKEVKNSHADPA